jgi:hypothetical protein
LGRFNWRLIVALRMVNTNSISARTEMLRQEIRLIQEDEGRYRSAKKHSGAEQTEHAKREFRLREIRAELETLQRPKKLWG